jgi:hypothetical protein
LSDKKGDKKKIRRKRLGIERQSKANAIQEGIPISPETPQP